MRDRDVNVDFERELTRRLHERAGRVRPSPDAWERIDARPRRPRGRLRAVLAAAAVCAVVVAAIVVVAPWRAAPRVAIGAGPSDAATSAPTTAPTAPPTSATPDAEPATGWSWKTAGLPDGAGRPTAVDGLAADGDRVVAVGATSPDGTHEQAGFWISDDGGAHWRAASVPDTGAEAWAVVHTSTGFVAVGGGADGAYAWTSADGASWQPTPVADGGVLYDVVATPAGALAVGSARGTNGRHAAVYRRGPDGTWTDLSGDEASFAAGSDTVLYHLARDAAGRLVASGYGPDGGLVNVWTSPDDGASWTYHGNGGIAGPGGVIDLLLPAGDGFVALQAGGAVWQSSDGQEWQPVGALPAVGGETARATAPPGGSSRGAVRLAAAVPAGPGWVLVGVQQGAAGRQAVTWSSADGRSWQAGDVLGNDVDPGLGAAVRGDGGVVVGASVPCTDCGGPGRAATFWRATAG